MHENCIRRDHLGQQCSHAWVFHARLLQAMNQVAIKVQTMLLCNAVCPSVTNQ